MQSESTVRQSTAEAPIMETQAPGPVEHAAEGEIHLAPSSVWPITLAAGITLAGMGLVTVVPVSIFGVIVMLWAIASWVQELRHEVH
jgi:hypothetical protein